MVIMVFANTYGCLYCYNVKKFIIIDNAKILLWYTGYTCGCLSCDMRKMVFTVGDSICIISVASEMVDRWCGNKKGVGKTGGIWWKDKGKL